MGNELPRAYGTYHELIKKYHKTRKRTIDCYIELTEHQYYSFIDSIGECITCDKYYRRVYGDVNRCNIILHRMTITHYDSIINNILLVLHNRPRFYKSTIYSIFRSRIFDRNVIRVISKLVGKRYRKIVKL